MLFTNQIEAYKKYSIGDYTYGTPVLRWCTPSTLKIGKFCSLAAGCTFMAGGNHRPDWITTYPFSALSQFFPFAQGYEGHPASKGPIVIENDVWIGQNALILSGVTVGNGAVIGAESVVTKNVLPYEVVAGNPARHLKFRCTEDQIAALLRIQWWHWNLEKISRYISLLMSQDITAFLEKAEKELEDERRADRKRWRRKRSRARGLLYGGTKRCSSDT